MLPFQVIIVSGAGAGFGRGITKKLVAENALVLAVDMNEHTVKETAASAPQGTCVPHTADITSEKSWQGILKAALDSFGRVDTLVNCAGVVHIAAPSHEVEEDEFDKVFKVNVKPIYLSTKVMVPYWKESGIEGHVINMSSISEPRPRPMLVWYASSKGAVTVVSNNQCYKLNEARMLDIDKIALARLQKVSLLNMLETRSGSTVSDLLWVKPLCECLQVSWIFITSRTDWSSPQASEGSWWAGHSGRS